ncbi:hypothetical protein AAZX31_15G187300 [Glycine max]
MCESVLCMRITLGTCIPREINTITYAIKIIFTGFGKRRKYPFLANLIPSIFCCFAKSKNAHLWYGLARSNWLPRGSLKVSQSLVKESLHQSLLAFVNKKSFGVLSLHLCMKLKLEGGEFKYFSSSSQLVLGILEPLSHQV